MGCFSHFSAAGAIYLKPQNIVYRGTQFFKKWGTPHTSWRLNALNFGKYFAMVILSCNPNESPPSLTFPTANVCH